MNRKAIFFSSIIIIVLAISIFGANKIFFQSSQNQIFQDDLIIFVAIVGAVVTLLSGFKDVYDFAKEGLSTPKSTFSWLTNYKKKYLEYMFFRHRNFDVKGLTTQGVYTLELSRIFVELSVAPRLAQDVSNNPIRVPQALQKGSHSIWSYLNIGKKRTPNFAIIGVPGSGKTTMLKHMTLALIGKARRQTYDKVPKKLPILLYLREHSQDIAEDRRQAYTLEDAIQKDLAKWDKAAPKGWFTEELNKGNCIVMLDGLDEVADIVVRLKVVQWVDRQLVAYPKNSFIVTSRPHGYRSNPLRDVTILEVRPFTSKQQIKFIHNWYVADEIQSQQNDDEGVRMDAKKAAEDLLQRLYHTPKLSELAVNPLLLTMIATVHKYRSSLPSRRVELYNEICDVFLGRRQLSKGIQLDLTPEQRKRVLQPLAWYMMENALREVSRIEAQQVIEPTLKLVQHHADPQSFLQNVENDSGLLVELESGTYSFAHLTFQEFLAAEHVRDQSHLLNSLLLHVKQSWWHESLLLYAAKADATPIIEACLESETPDDASPLLLAVACLEEAREVHPETQARLEQVLVKSLHGHDRRKVGLLARVHLQQRILSVIRIHEGQAVDVSLITNAEYQLFIDEYLAQDHAERPIGVYERQYESGQGGLPAFGLNVDEVQAFCSWLTDALDDGYEYTIPQMGDAEHIPMKSEAHIMRAGYWVRDKKGYTVQMFVGQYPSISLKILNQYRSRALVAALKLERTQSLAWKDDFDLNLILMRYVTAAKDLDFRIARTNSVTYPPFPTARYISHAQKLNQKVISKNFNPDIAMAKALVQDLESEYGDDAHRDLGLFLMLAGLLLSRMRLEEENFNWSVTSRSAYKEWRKFATQLIVAYTTAFVNLCLLEEKRKGVIVPFEGIRLMRIRKAN